jgi:hypothetical protein
MQWQLGGWNMKTAVVVAADTNGHIKEVQSPTRKDIESVGGALRLSESPPNKTYLALPFEGPGRG